MDKIYNALSNQVRRKILEILNNEEERSVSWILERLTVSQPTLSLHLNILERTGLLTVRKIGRWRMYKFNKLLWEKFIIEINKLVGSGLFEEINPRKV